MKQMLAMLSLAGALLLTGCGVIYKVNIAQGNKFEQKDLEDLRPGLTKNQVLSILGTPAVQDPFHADRWDYVYYYKNHRSGTTDTKELTLFFENGRLARMEGDTLPENVRDLSQSASP